MYALNRQIALRNREGIVDIEYDIAVLNISFYIGFLFQGEWQTVRSNIPFFQFGGDYGVVVPVNKGIFRRQVLEAIDLDAVRSNGYTFQVEMNYICDRKGFRIHELPFHFEDRTLGKSKMDWRIGLEAMWRVWQIKFRY